jgi:putative ABC transport system permease protein
MIFRDFLEISVGNLWRMKLRACLTISGVLIAIAALVSMVSFGAGNQQNIQDHFNRFGLFSTIQVYPRSEGDSLFAPLDGAALIELARVPGVRLVYPYKTFEVTVRSADSVISTTTQALPSAALATLLFSDLKAGRQIVSDTARECVISDQAMDELGIIEPDSAIGRTIIVARKVASLDSAFAHLIADDDWNIRDAVRAVSFDSLRQPEYRRGLVETEVGKAIQRFTFGFLNAQGEMAESLTVVGVMHLESGHHLRIQPVIVSPAVGRRFEQSGAGGSPVEMMTALTQGTLFSRADTTSGSAYRMVTVNIDETTGYGLIKDSIESLGFTTFSYAEEFKEIREVFFYVNLALGGIGLIALFTASLGIINALVMSIIERTREIGTLKALGADERDIRLLFLAESAVIGLVGAAGGIVFGWLITRVASFVARQVMENKGIDPMELFALPWWLILIALALGLVVSMLAGLYPAARAARIDPVQALRGE